MTDAEFETLVRESVAHAETGQVAIAEVFASDDRTFDEERGRIQFLAAGEPLVDAAVVCIGSWATRSGSWMWSWAIDSMPEGLRKGADRLKQLAGITGRAEFAERNAFVTTEAHVWKLGPDHRQTLRRYLSDLLSVVQLEARCICGPPASGAYRRGRSCVLGSPRSRSRRLPRAADRSGDSRVEAAPGRTLTRQHGQ